MWLSRKHNQESDEVLCAAYFKSGNKELLGALFDRHVRTVFGACLFYFRDKAKAEDAVMHIFEKLIVELRKAELRNFKAWLSFVVRNHCISELRKARNFRSVSESYLEFELRESAWEEEEAMNAVSEEVLLNYLQECLPQLKSKQKRCIEMFYLEGMSYQLISQQTGFSLNEVKSRIQNGKRSLKLMIEQKLRNESDAA